MMLFTDSEFRTLVEPVLGCTVADRNDAVASIALSCIIEPGDGLAGQLADLLSPSAFLVHLIGRSSAGTIADTLGSETVLDLETDFNRRWQTIWDNALERWLPRLSKNELVSAIEWMKAAASGIATGHSLVIRGSAEYPSGLEDLGRHAPPALWCLGDRNLLAERATISVVGTRNASQYGLETAADLAVVAGQAGIVSVSGGAFGIDAAIHGAALALNAPTVAVMAGGLANLYPKSNISMLTSIANESLLFSESAPWVTPAKFRFLQRNRLIAALGKGTIVVEAGATSGALSTANRALELGRQVAVVPGPINSSRSVGCHDFANSYAGLVQVLARPQDVLALAGLATNATATPDGLGRLEKRALDCFTGTFIEAWEVQRLAGLTVRETQIALGSLELLGLVERRGTAYRGSTG